VAVEVMERRASERGVAVRAIRADVLDTPFPRPPYQVIANFSFLERALFERFEQAVAPGGLLIFETFTRDHVEAAGGSIPAGHTLDRGELRAAFPALELVDYREAIVDRDLGPGRKGVASLVACRRRGGA
jgi:tellurite methyltransferase